GRRPPAGAWSGVPAMVIPVADIGHFLRNRRSARVGADAGPTCSARAGEPDWQAADRHTEHAGNDVGRLTRNAPGCRLALRDTGCSRRRPRVPGKWYEHARKSGKSIRARGATRLGRAPARLRETVR